MVGREGNAMTHAIHQWQAAYRSAVFETDPKQLSIRINEARRAIDARLHRPLLIDSPEHRALEDAGEDSPSLKQSEKALRPLEYHTRLSAVRNSWKCPELRTASASNSFFLAAQNSVVTERGCRFPWPAQASRKNTIDSMPMIVSCRTARKPSFSTTRIEATFFV